MALSLGIVGLPNVGKSTLFTALTRKHVAVSNYPFTTIDPAIGVVAVPDDRLEKIASLATSSRIVPATVTFIDIAGLVRGANKGEGLGNQFLAKIREVDAIIEVIRAFDDPEIIHVEGAPDPLRDHDIIETELALKDLETVEKYAAKVENNAHAGSRREQQRAGALKLIRDALREGTPVRAALSRVDKDPLASVVAAEAMTLSLLTAKPMLAVLNSAEGRRSHDVISALANRGIRAIAIDLKTEYEAAALSDKEREDLGLAESALGTLIGEAYTMLHRVTFFTANENEAHAWSVRKGTSAREAAGSIHSDFEAHFIRADVIAWEDFVAYGGWAGCRARGLVRSEGKDYAVRDGDVIDIKHAP